LGTVLRRHLPATVGVLAGNTLVAALLLQIRWNAATIAMLPVLLGLLYTTYRGNLSAREDRDTWRELEAASKDLANLDVDHVAMVSASRSLRLARADEVEILLRANDGPGLMRYHLGASGEFTQSHTDAGVLDLLDLQSGALVSSVSESLVSGATTSSHALVMRLDTPENDQALGALRLHFRSGVRLTDRERQVLVTFGRSVAASVYNAQLYEQTREASRRHEHEATHDSLTGLPNRALLVRRAAEYLSAPDANVSLLLVDLDHFKSINDTLGHPTGDRLLQAAAQRLEAVLRQTDTIARLGGDEFGVLLEGCTPEQSARIADGVRQAVKDYRFIWGATTLTVGASVGVVQIDADTESVAAIMSAADIACYAAKDEGRNRVHVYEADGPHRHREMHWVARVTRAAEENRLELFFQPIVRIGAESPPNFHELTIRLRDDDGRLVPPSEFIPAAERYNVMSTIDRWVVIRAVELLKRRRDSGGPLPMLAVNLSGTSLNEQSFAEFILQTVGEPEIASALCFEITETAAVTSLSNVTFFMRELKARGCKFALDDFGTGLSSFMYLKTLPVDYLKIDGQFIMQIATDAVDRSMVEAISKVGRALGIATVAEWVEDEAVLDELKRIGVDFAQGYHMARPQPLAQLE
jgi:diguanylate cyclase (GGDEF)-like protein